MCLSISAKVLSVDGNVAVISVNGLESRTNLQLLGEVEEGDYVLVHTGFAIQKLSEQEAEETFKLFDELNKSYESE